MPGSSSSEFSTVAKVFIRSEVTWLTREGSPIMVLELNFLGETGLLGDKLLVLSIFLGLFLLLRKEGLSMS